MPGADPHICLHLSRSGTASVSLGGKGRALNSSAGNLAMSSSWGRGSVTGARQACPVTWTGGTPENMELWGTGS